MCCNQLSSARRSHFGERDSTKYTASTVLIKSLSCHESKFAGGAAYTSLTLRGQRAGWSSAALRSKKRGGTKERGNYGLHTVNGILVLSK